MSMRSTELLFLYNKEGTYPVSYAQQSNEILVSHGGRKNYCLLVNESEMCTLYKCEKDSVGMDEC